MFSSSAVITADEVVALLFYDKTWLLYIFTNTLVK